MKQGFGDTFKKKLEAFNALKERLPKLLGNEAKNNFQDNFTKQGFEGGKWTEVQRRISGTNSYKYPKTKGLGRRTKAILSGTGKLKKDIQVKEVSFGKTVVGTSSITEDYAMVHNEGTATIPQRKFIGGSQNLTNKMKEIIFKELKKLFA